MSATEEFILHHEVKNKLEKLVEKEGIINYTFNIESGSAKGDNYLGLIAKLTIKGIRKKPDVAQNVTLNWIVKNAPQTEAYRKYNNIRDLFLREAYMYDKIFPLFQNYQEEKEVKELFTSTAPLHLSYMQEFQESLIMEDMKALGYQMRDRKQPLDFNHVRLVMKTYGKFHAISYALKDQKPDLMKKLAVETDENYFTKIEKELLEVYDKKLCEKALKALDPEKDKKYLDQFGKYAYDNTTSIVRETFSDARNDPFAIIGHGDSWVNNMLFKYDDPNQPNNPTEICLLDFQLARYGSPAFDLSYFIFACTDKTLRDKHYDQMIGIYYDELCSHLLNLGSDPQKLLPFHALEAQLKRYSICGLYMCTMVLPLMMSESDEIPDYMQVVSEEQINEMSSFDSRNDPLLYERLRSVIVDFVDKGYLDFLNK